MEKLTGYKKELARKLADDAITYVMDKNAPVLGRKPSVLNMPPGGEPAGR